MRIKRASIAPALLAIGVAGSLVAGPAIAALSAIAPAAPAVVAATATPDAYGYHA